MKSEEIKQLVAEGRFRTISPTSGKWSTLAPGQKEKLRI